MGCRNWALCAVVLMGCTEKIGDIVLNGTLYDGEEGSSLPVGEAAVQIREEDGSKGDSTSTGVDGAFRVEIAPQQSFTAVFSGEGAVPTSFAATAGLADIEAHERQVWTRSEGELDDIATTFGDCGARGGASIEGTVYLYVADLADYHNLPIVTTAWVSALDEAGALHIACYLDEEGVYDSLAEETGDTGRFAIFGLPGGVSLIRIGFVLGTSSQTETVFPIWLEEGGSAPLYPALVQSDSF